MEALENNPQQLTFITSGAAPTQSIKPLFFYHLPKCAGISFFNAIRLSAYWAHRRIREEVDAQFIAPVVARFDNVEDLVEVKGQPINIIGGHLPYGAHRELGVDCYLATLVRDPYKRVLSEYTYNCMRAGEMPNEADFATFAADPDNINLMCRQLAPEQGTAEAAIVHLRDHFHAYTTNQRVNEMVHLYQSVYQFPNVLVERMNETQAHFQLKPSDAIAQTVRAANTEDQALFEFVRDNPRLPTVGESAGLADRTVVIYNTKTEASAEQNAIMVKTQDVLPLLHGRVWRNLDMAHVRSVLTLGYGPL